VLGMKRISVFIAERQLARLQALGEEYGQPYAELIREALNAYLRQKDAEAAVRQKAERKRAATRKRP